MAEADAGARRLDFEACTRVRTQRGWRVNLRYTRVEGTTELRCRFGGQFFVHVHPTFSSESGEVAPDGSAVYLVVGPKPTIVASATVDRRSSASVLSFSRRYCRAGMD